MYVQLHTFLPGNGSELNWPKSLPLKAYSVSKNKNFIPRYLIWLWIKEFTHIKRDDGSQLVQNLYNMSLQHLHTIFDSWCSKYLMRKI